MFYPFRLEAPAQKQSPQRHLTHSKLFLISALVGLICLAGLMYRAGTAPARAAAGPLLEPARPAPAAPGNAIQAQAQITAQTTVTPLDVVVVFDISGSTEDQTICDDCWVRTSYNPDWPNNGYFNPLPYNPAWAAAGTGNHSIPQSGLCTVYPPQPFITNTYQYLTVEAELYSRNAGNWDLSVRTPGQGFWAVQRGSKDNWFSTNTLGEDNEQRNAAGNPTMQSSNVCRPNIVGGPSLGIDCTVGTSSDDVCSSADGGFAADCSGYIAARPFNAYGQSPGNMPYMDGAAYNADCFSGSALSGNCWSNNPFKNVPGLEVGPSYVPWVEYDFTPTWSGNTYIWIRAIGGNDYSFTWAGARPDEIQPDPDNDKTNNLTPWRKVIYWQVGNGTIFQRKDNLNADYSNSPADDNSGYFQRASGWRDNRAENARWRWIKLGSISTSTYRTQYTLRLYQGSAGYKVDKIVFTNDPNGTTDQAGSSASNLPAALRRSADGTIAFATDYGNQLGPPASFGSATREACNICNPAYGYQIAGPLECTCKKDVNETGYGTGQGCTLVLTQTNMVQDQLETGLYSGLQPLRSAQEALKHLTSQLDPRFDQLAFVPFTSDPDNTDAQADSTRRVKLQCLSWAGQRFGDPARCYDSNLDTPISYTSVISAVEKQWPENGTDLASGIKEGLEELGVPGFAANSNCTATPNDGSACDRGSAARRVLILLTDGSPNANPGNCDGTNGRPDLWDGLIGTEDPNFECAMYYASLAAQNNVTLYTIGVGAGHSMDLLMAMATGVDPRGDYDDVKIFDAPCGRYFPAARPTDLDLVFDYNAARMRNCRPNAPGLVLTQIDSPDPVLAGGVLMYNLAVTNYGTLSATGVIVTDTLDSRVSFASASDGGLLNNGVVTWNVGTVAPNEAIVRTLVVTVGNAMSGTVLGNTAGLTSNENISLSQAITTTVVDPPLPAPALTLTKVDLADPVLAGNRLSYTLNLANNGSATATGVILTDTLNNGVSFVTASDGGNFNNNLVTWNINSISPGQIIARSLVVTVNKSFTASLLSNTAWVAAAQGGSQSATVTTTVTSAIGEQIWTLNYKVGQGSALVVHMENHFNQAGPYDIYLKSSDGNFFKVCEAVNTALLTNSGDFSCPVSDQIPPGFYTLLSTLTGSYAPVAAAPQQVEVMVGSSPQLQIDNGTGGNIAAVNSYITLTLVAHQIADQPFDLFFVNPTDLTSLKIFNDVPAIPSSPLIWRVPGSLLSPSNPCPVNGTTPCLIQSHDKNDQVYVSGEFYLNAPEIVLTGGNRVYAAGEATHVFLRGHTPGLAYDLKFSDGLSNTVWLGRTSVANSMGDVGFPVAWTIPITWPNGVYTITSHPAVGSTPRDPVSLTSMNQIGSLTNVQINTPVPPILTIEGGYIWPADTSIIIRVHDHPAANGAYYLQFGPWRVPTGTSGDTFQTNATGSAILNYHIPFTAAAGVSKTFTISSFLASNNSLQATHPVTVLPPPPAITVLEGKTVLPNSTITISLTNHSPNSTYQVVYANKTLSQMLTDSQGRSQRSYNLNALPASPPPDLSDPANQGIFFELRSENLTSPGSRVATTTLAIAACTNPLQQKSFENPPLTSWTLGEGVIASPDYPHSGTFRLLAPTFDSQFRQPFFYQQFTMPGLVVPAILNLRLYRNVNDLSDGSDGNDRFYTVLAAGPTLSSTLLTSPTLVAVGILPQLPIYNPSAWFAGNINLVTANGINLADFKDQPVYLHFYNRSNAGCIPPSTNCHATHFYFDDVDLAICGPSQPVFDLNETHTPDPATPGSSLIYTLTLANLGSIGATDMVMSATLDSKVNFLSASQGGLHNSGVVRWLIETLPPGQIITRTLAVTVSNAISGTVLSHTVVVTSSGGISSSRVITTTISNSMTALLMSTYLPVILKQQ